MPNRGKRKESVSHMASHYLFIVPLLAKTPLAILWEWECCRVDARRDIAYTIQASLIKLDITQV